MEEDRHLLVAIQRYFGGLNQALERIGVDYGDVMRVQPWDEVAYGKDLLAWCAKHGPLSPKQVSETAPRLYRFARNRYGSLKQAARHHNLPFKGQRTRWTRERVAEELRNYHRRYGPLQEHKLYAFSLPLYMATRRYFGSLRNAASELLLPFVSAFKTWDEQIIIDELRSRAEEKRPLQAPIVQKEGGGLFKAAIRYFGSWKKAKEAAGV
jgi:hypothetical protein